MLPHGTTGGTRRRGLFDLSVDPSETRNLAAEKPEVRAKLKARFDQWRAEMEATEPRGPFRNY